MQKLGLHYIAEFWECPKDVLDDKTRLQTLSLAAAESARVTVISSQFHQFSPHGVTGILLLSESHLSIHTWPEYGYAAADVSFFEEDNWDENITIQSGLYLPVGDLARTYRVGLEYYDGRSQIAEFFRSHETYVAFGFWFDL